MIKNALKLTINYVNGKKVFKTVIHKIKNVSNQGLTQSSLVSKSPVSVGESNHIIMVVGYKAHRYLSKTEYESEVICSLASV